MPNKIKEVTVPFDCPCDRKLSLFKCFQVLDQTPPENVVVECPMCEQDIKLKLEHQLNRTDSLLRDITIKSITLE
ncbi:MAG: hypothetical protein ACPGVB_09130 [Chitinophagales bacterium]